ncbi:MAG: hypothetical protein GY953_37135 [bacterium]|nr:hypothetical protein [bacterium]
MRVAAAEALGRYGSPTDAAMAVKTLIACGDAENNGVFLALMALNALDYVGESARPFKKEIEALPDKDPQGTTRIPKEVRQLKTSILDGLR